MYVYLLNPLRVTRLSSRLYILSSMSSPYPDVLTISFPFYTAFYRFLNRKGSAIEGMIIESRDDMAMQCHLVNGRYATRRRGGDLQVKARKEVWSVVAVYVNGDMKLKRG